MSGITGHQKQQQNHHQILRVKILRKQSPQKAAHTGGRMIIVTMGTAGGRIIIWGRGVIWPWRGTNGWLWRSLSLGRLLGHRRSWGTSGLLGNGFWDLAPAKGTVRLGNISIIHGTTFLRMGIGPGNLPSLMRFLPFLLRAWPAPAFPASACSGKAVALSKAIPGFCRWTHAASVWPSG